MGEITVYEPNHRSKQGLFKTWVVMFQNIIKSRELIYQLFKRDFLMMYKKSFLGMGWLIIAPIMGIISWVFMNATGILAPGEVGIPYPAYVLLSTSIWGLFMNFYRGATETLAVSSGFIMQVKFPHDILLVKQSLQQLANFAITFIINIIVLLIFGVYPSLMTLLFPLLMLPVFFLGSAIGLVVSVISVVAVDLKRGFSFVMALLMYITPVIYSPDVKDPLIQKLIKWNPLTYLIGGLRDSIIYGRIEHFDRFLISGVLALFIFLLAWRLFYISEEKVIEKMI